MMTSANAPTTSFDHDRCQVMLRSDDMFQQWRSGTREEAYSLAEAIYGFRAANVRNILDFSALLLTTLASISPRRDSATAG